MTFRCRKNERVEAETNAYVETFAASGCEDCVFVVPCAVGAVTVSDCKRCVFLLGPTREAARVRARRDERVVRGRGRTDARVGV